MTRVAFIHTGAVVIAPFSALASELLPEIDVQHLLDDKIVGDLRRGDGADLILARLVGLGHAAKAAGAEALMLTCSSISEFASPLAGELGVDVYRVDEAMADRAVQTGSRVSVLATLDTTLGPTTRLLEERAAAKNLTTVIDGLVIPGAFEAIVAGDRDRHDSLVTDAVSRAAASHDVVVLAQASMASAAEVSEVDVPVLSSPRLGVERFADRLSSG